MRVTNEQLDYIYRFDEENKNKVKSTSNNDLDKNAF